MDKLEGKLEEHPQQLLRSCVELAKMWRTDKILRHLQVRTVSVTTSSATVVRL